MSTRSSVVSPLLPRISNRAIKGIQRGKAQDVAAEQKPGKRTRNWLSAELTARDLMHRCEATLRPEDSIERAARLMTETGDKAIPVVDAAGRLIGIITSRDITMRLIALGASIPHTQVSDCMTAEVFACSAANSLDSCMSAMCWHQVKRIPIVDDEHKVLGTISQRDVAQYLCDHFETVKPEEMVDILWALAS